MRALILIFLLAAVPRHRPVVRDFMAQHPCPGGSDAGSKVRCSGWVVDHIVPLCAGGADATTNMQWQSAECGAQKDRLELNVCRHKVKLIP